METAPAQGRGLEGMFGPGCGSIWRGRRSHIGYAGGAVHASGGVAGRLPRRAGVHRTADTGRRQRRDCTDLRHGFGAGIHERRRDERPGKNRFGGIYPIVRSNA